MISGLIDFVKQFFSQENKQVVEYKAETAEKPVLKKTQNDFIKGKTQSMIDNQALSGYLDVTGKVNNAGHEKLHSQRGHRHS